MEMDELIIITINTYIKKRKEHEDMYDTGYLACVRDMLRHLGVDIDDLDGD